MKFAHEIHTHLIDKLIPFWESMKDDEKGGFYGYKDFDLKTDKNYDKGCILNSRILWFFSNAYLLLKDESLREYADHAYRFMKEHCIDHEYGGIFWSVTEDGEVSDDTKHTYNQAFAIYALSSYYDASKDEEALALAKGLVQAIEQHCTDEFGYLEAFDRKFEPVDNEKLSENGVIAEKTMNTLLHVLEAYTELYRVTGDAYIGERLRYQLDLFYEKVYNPELGRQEVFFDREWHTLIDLYSYGHDIETSWLIDRALEVLGDEEYSKKILPVTRILAENIYKVAYVDHSLLSECENGVPLTTRTWWVQAETVVGFVNLWQKDSAQKEYLEAAEDVWEYIKECFVDKREGSEWYRDVDADRKPLHEPIVEPWKCPYHNGRMCMEITKRLLG